MRNYLRGMLLMVAESAFGGYVRVDMIGRYLRTGEQVKAAVVLFAIIGKSKVIYLK